MPNAILTHLRSLKPLSKKSCPVCYCKSLYENVQDLLDLQYGEQEQEMNLVGHVGVDQTADHAEATSGRQLSSQAVN